MTKFWLSTRGRIFVRTRKKETEREQRAACMGVGVGVCVCFVLLIGNLEKKPRSWQRSRWKGEEEKTRKGHCLRTQRCHAFQEKGGVVGSPQLISYCFISWWMISFSRALLSPKIPTIRSIVKWGVICSCEKIWVINTAIISPKAFFEARCHWIAEVGLS